MGVAAYDDIADWYEHEFLAAQAGRDPLGINRALHDLLGEGTGPCLEIGCGTGIHAAQLRTQGWTPLGVDLSAAMLRHAQGRLPITQADAAHLPIRDNSVRAVISVMVHTDIPAYPTVLREVERVLTPGGVFAHIGVHPCFCGGFADHTQPDAVLIRPGYLDTYWTKESWTTQGIRDKVGASHRPLPDLLHAFLTAGLTLEHFTEGGTPTPIMLAIKARKSQGARR
jgi:ubiquinone/menaquinone biosynthesis C-methylase UbiE